MRKRVGIFVAAVLMLTGLVAVDIAQGGPFTAQIEQFWLLISNGGRTFQNLQAVNVTVSGTCTGCGGVSANPSFDTITMNVATATAKFKFGIGNSNFTNAGQVFLGNGANRQSFSIFGVEGVDVTTSNLCQIFPSNTAGTGVNLFKCGRGDFLGSGSLAFNAETTTSFQSNSTTIAAVVSGGTNIRSDRVYGFSNTVSGPQSDAITAGLQFEAAAKIKATDGGASYGSLDALSFLASNVPITQGSTHLSAGSGMAVANVGANSCGTTAATIAGNNNAFVFTVGATSGTQCRVAFTFAAATEWDCTESDETNAVAAQKVTPVDTTHTDFFGTYTAGDKVTGICFPR